MRKHWWQSIRWRLALGSVLVTLVATSLLTLAVLVAIVYFYGSDQEGHMRGLAGGVAEQIGVEYGMLGNLREAVNVVEPVTTIQNTQDQDYLVVIFDHRNRMIRPSQPATIQNGTMANFLLRLVDPDRQKGDLVKLHADILKAQRGIAVADELGKGWPPQPFVVQPIHASGVRSGAVIGVIFITPRSAVEKTVPPFVAAVGRDVLIASLIVVILAAGAAILFSRTITRPLATLTNAARKMAAGDYKAQVATDARGELGELATSFNEMAAQLNRDVEELHKQELWRRELIMSITHDLATPLTAIAGLGDSLIDGVNQSREDYEATGRIIVRETLRLRRLVKDLHIMARVEAGALHPQRKPVRLAALANEVLAVLVTEFERAHVEPCNTIPYDLPAIDADPDMLTRVFSNLCDNALRFTPAGGLITIDARQEGDAIIVSVSDTGPGIPPEALPYIFERFFRVDSARQSATGGSGLGLAIVRAIVEAHGGRVWAENVPTGGARINFTLPSPSPSPTLSS